MMKLLILLVLITSHFNYLHSEEKEYEELIRIGNNLQEAGEYDRVIKLMKEALDINPKSELAYYQIGLAYYMKDDYNLAIKYCEQSLEISDILKSQNYIVLAKAYEKRRKWTDLEKLMEVALNDSLDSEVLYFTLAEMLFLDDKFLRSLDFVERAISINYNHIPSHFLITNIYYILGFKISFINSSSYFILRQLGTDKANILFNNLFRTLLHTNFNYKVKDTFKFYIATDYNNPDELFKIKFESIKQLEYVFNDFVLHNNSKDIYKFIENQLTKATIFYQDNIDEIELTDTAKNFYIPTITSIMNSYHKETFIRLLCYNFHEESANWLNENQDKIDQLNEWIFGS